MTSCSTTARCARRSCWHHHRLNRTLFKAPSPAPPSPQLPRWPNRRDDRGTAFNTGGRCALGWAAGDGAGGRSGDVRFAGYRAPHLFPAAARGDGPGVLCRRHHRDRSPRRFAAAINQPPLLSYGAILPVDWRGGEAGERCWIVDPIDGTNNSCGAFRCGASRSRTRSRGSR